MENFVYLEDFNAPEYDRKEILRYSGVKNDVVEINEIINECINELKGQLSFKVCYSFFPITIIGEEIDFGFARIKSKTLSKHLSSCKKVVMFSATIGVKIDRLIAKYTNLSPTKALIFQSIGTERIESLCNLFCNKIQTEHKNVTPRYSPGYGDFPLEFQKYVFAVLDCHKKIGLSLNESLLMSPSKSVTAIIGISSDYICKAEQDCSVCESDCLFRRK